MLCDELLEVLRFIVSPFLEIAARRLMRDVSQHVGRLLAHALRHDASSALIVDLDVAADHWLGI